jgi:G3E family GTPase
MIYADLATARGTDKPSALKLALRKRWPRRKDNHGTMQVCVPPEWARPWSDNSAADMPPVTASGTADTVDVAGLISVLEAAIAAAGERAAADASTIPGLQAYLASERTRADAFADLVGVTQTRLADTAAAHDRAERRAEAANERADQAEAGRDAERSRADVLADRAHVLQAERDQASNAAAALRRVDVARRQMFVLARLRAAWRGE